MSQLDFLLGPKMKSSRMYIHKNVRLWHSWGHHPVYATIREDEGQGNLIQRRGRDGQDGGRVTTKQDLTSRWQQWTRKAMCKMRTWTRFNDVLRTRQKRSIILRNLTDEKGEENNGGSFCERRAAARSSRTIERKVLMKQARDTVKRFTSTPRRKL